MLIYKIFNAIVPNSEYICDSQATIDSRPIIPPNKQQSPPENLCSIGGQPEANAMLLANQQTWLTQQSSLFVVNLQTVVEGGVVWTVVDLSQQEPNTDKQYFILDPTTGLYTEAIGLDAANALFVQTQQTYLAFTNMNAYTTMNSWT